MARLWNTCPSSAQLMLVDLSQSLLICMLVLLVHMQEPHGAALIANSKRSATSIIRKEWGQVLCLPLTRLPSCFLKTAAHLQRLMISGALFQAICMLGMFAGSSRDLCCRLPRHAGRAILLALAGALASVLFAEAMSLLSLPFRGSEPGSVIL